MKFRCYTRVQCSRRCLYTEAGKQAASNLEGLLSPAFRWLCAAGLCSPPHFDCRSPLLSVGLRSGGQSLPLLVVRLGGHGLRGGLF